MTSDRVLSRRRLLTLTVAGALAGSGCRGESPPQQPTGPLPDDQIVFMVQTWVALAPPVYAAVSGPSLAVHGNGTVVWIGPDLARADAPPRYLTAQVDPLAVARFAADADATGLIGEGVDYGIPPVTDLPATTITLHGTGATATTTVAGFSATVEDRLTRGQRADRRRLRELIDRATAVTSEAEVVDYVPSRVVVLEQDGRYAAEATRAWPGPDPDTFLHAGDAGGVRYATACGALTGARAQQVYLAAQANPGQVWLVEGRSRVLAVNALPIGIDC